MPIPPARRVIFTPNPLVEVVTQFAFPRLLELDAELPVQFQKLVQAEFPILEASKVIEVTIDMEKGDSRRAPEGRRYVFFSPDRKWQAALTSDFLALTTTEYVRWEGFRHRAVLLLGAFLKCYKPVHFHRIGLRYRDVLTRSKLKLKDIPWRDLLAPPIAGMLSTGDVDEKDVLGCRTSCAFSVSPTIKVQLNHGIVAGREGEHDYMIDMDFFIDQPTEANADAGTKTLESFRPHPSDLFNWCISKQLYDAMDPQPATPHT
jgi:uncharacterized protein (TIGR04255 family)